MLDLVSECARRWHESLDPSAKEMDCLVRFDLFIELESNQRWLNITSSRTTYEVLPIITFPKNSNLQQRTDSK